MVFLVLLYSKNTKKIITKRPFEGAVFMEKAKQVGTQNDLNVHTNAAIYNAHKYYELVMHTSNSEKSLFHAYASLFP